MVSSISTGCGRAEQGLGFTGLGSGHLGRARRPDFRGGGESISDICMCLSAEL